MATAANSINESTTGVCGFTGTAFTATPVTNHAVILGGATTSTLGSVGPSATTGQILQNNSGADPTYSTATYPSTTTANEILYSSSANVVGQITAVNSASLVTSSAGVPSLAAMTSGQLIIGTPGGTPTAALPTSTGGNYLAGTGTLKYIPANYMPGVSNIGITYSAGTFTVNGFDGTALSATNPGYVTTQSATSGQLVTTAVTANQTFTDGTGNLDTWACGVSPTDLQGGVSSNWAQDMPFFLYAVLGTANDVAFMIARNPCATLSPAATHISKTGTILNVDQTDMFSLAGGTIANYASRPCICVGSFRMRNVVNAGTIRYTVQALSGSDGIGQFQEGVVFTFPSGVNSNIAGKFFGNAGTVPTFTSNKLFYTIDRNGWTKFKFDLQACNNTPAGANIVQLGLPYANFGGMDQFTDNPTFVKTNGVTNVKQLGVGGIAVGVSTTGGVAASGFIVDGSSSDLLNTDFSNSVSGTSFQGFAFYKAF